MTVSKQHIRTTESGMKVYLYSKRSKGLEGTYANAKCHAQPTIPLIKVLEPWVEHLRFKSWTQAHNVHEFESFDGRVYKLRPLRTKAMGFLGIEIKMVQPTVAVIYQFTDADDAPFVAALLQKLALPQVLNEYTGVPLSERVEMQ